MQKIERCIPRLFHIDTNRINSRCDLPAMNKIEQWEKNGVIHIGMSLRAQKEAMFGNDYLRNKKALGYIYTETLATTSEEKKQINIIKQILFSKGKINSNKRNDIEIVFNALKYGAILITDDGTSKSRIGILDHKYELKKSLGIIIMTDVKAVEFIQGMITKRDKRVKMQCERYGFSLPYWVGKD